MATSKFGLIFCSVLIRNINMIMSGSGKYGAYAPYTSYKRGPAPEAEAEEKRDVAAEEVKREPAPEPVVAPKA